MKISRALALVGAALFFAAIYGVAPFALSLLSRRHFWHDGRPGGVNWLGLIVAAAGSALLVWVTVQHFEKSPAGWRGGNPFEGPGYVLSKGPYRFSRHPMHIATISIWSGWALYYGSLAVAIASALLLLVIVSMVPGEERGIEAKMGDQYRQYKARVPRWLGMPRSRS